MNNKKSLIPITQMKPIKALTEGKYTIIEYLEKEFSTFEQKPFNEVDALILSQLCYLNFERIVPGIEEYADWMEITSLYRAELFEKMIYKTLAPNSNLALIRAICASPRYRNVKLNYFLNIYNKTNEEQFSAVTYQLSDDHIVIAFRGTDLTVTGWKEDFNMFFISPVPSQLTSVKYLNAIAGKINADITLVGHSKGGNLAVYSNAFCKEKVHRRILKVYNLDGPGFPKDILEHCDFIKEQDKIIKIVPEGSIIGLLFEDENFPSIIKSHNLGFLQHDPFSWKCDDEKFVVSSEFNMSIRYLDKTFNTWVYEMNVEERKTMVDALFTLVTCLEVESLDELALSLFKKREELKKVLKQMDIETSACIKEIVKRFLLISIQTRFGSKEKQTIQTIIDEDESLN